MKFNLKSILALGLVGTLLVGCDDEATMPANPTIPVATEPGNEMVIYEANPRFFATENCLDAMTARLDDIKAMGANVLWVMPINEPGVENAIGSPYCVKDFKAVNAKYGTLADFKELVDAAHSKGMKVILDWIANHTAWDCAWTANKNWYTQDADGNIVSPSGWADVAELNFDNADMRAAMIDAMLYWVRETGIDGYRCDHVDGVPVDFWADAINQLRGINPDLLLLAESSDAAYFDAGFDMNYGWTYASKLKDLFSGKIAPAKFFDESKKELANLPEGKKVMRYAINHDVAAENTVESLYGSVQGEVAAFVLTTMLDGVPMIYSSQETAYTGTISFFDYNPLDWNSGNAAEYQKIMAAYAQSKDVRGGALYTYENGKVATFARVSGNHTLVVMVNTSKNAATAKMPISVAGMSATDLISGTAETLPAAVDLDGYGYRVWMK